MINNAFDFIVLIVIPCIGLFWVIGGFDLFVKPNSKSHELTSSGATVMIDKLCEDLTVDTPIPMPDPELA